MKITKTKLTIDILKLVRPLVTAQATIPVRPIRILKLKDEAGNIGVGEASPLIGFSEETVDDVDNSFGNLLAEGGPMDGVEIGDDLESIRQFLASMTAPTTVLHALDEALLDLLGQRLGKPVAKLINPNAREKVELHKLIRDSVDAGIAVTEGIHTLKVKVGVASVAADDAKLEAIREAVGPDVAIRIDANGAWNPTMAIRALEKMSRHNLQCVEQPVPADDLEGMAEVRRESGLKIAADESVRDVKDMDRLLAANAADAVVIKPMLCGGLLAAHDIAKRAADAGLAVFYTTAMESAVGRMGALHAAAAAPGELWACGLDTGHMLVSDVGDELPMSDGFVTLPTIGGIGVQMKEM